MTEALQATLTRRFAQARDGLRTAWTATNLQHRIMMAVAEAIEDELPEWLQVGPIDTFLDLAYSFDERYRKIGESLAWLDQLEQGREQGSVTFKPSATVPGDIDVEIDPDSIAAVPMALKNTVQVTGLAGAQVLIFVGLLAGIAVLKIGTDFLSEQEITTRKEYDFLISKMLLESDAPASVKAKVATLMQEWAKAQTEPESLGDQVSNVLKWAAIAGVTFAGLGLLLQWWKWRQEAKG